MNLIIVINIHLERSAIFSQLVCKLSRPDIGDNLRDKGGVAFSEDGKPQCDQATISLRAVA